MFTKKSGAPRIKSHIQPWPYLLVAPAFLIVLGVVLVPAVKALMMSFQNYDLRYADYTQFVGLKNYKEALSDKQFWSALEKTVIYVVGSVSLQFIFGFALALLLNRHFKGRGFVRAASMIPWVVPGVLVGLIWRWMYDGNYGVINDMLTKTGILDHFVPFLTQTSTAMAACIITLVWQGIPFFTLMILAGLQGIPGELYEAAAIDGANYFQRLFRVTIPTIKNTIMVSLMLRIIWVANSVDVIFNMTEGGPGTATQTLSVYIYQKTKAMNLGSASTMAILLMILLMLIAVPYMVNNFRHEED